LRFLFGYYNDVTPASICQQDIVHYLNYIEATHGVGRDKCRMACSAFAFFFRYVSPTPYVLPSELYPRKEFRLPDILSVKQFSKLYGCITNLKHKAIIGMLYGTGMRLSEIRYLCMSQIDRTNYQVKVIAGKGNKRQLYFPFFGSA